jgi:ABC-type phosphate transport system substrate-binding protein
LSSIVVLLAVAGSAASALPADFKVIVNSSVAGSSISKQSLSDIYLGRTVRWGDRSMITPVDFSATSPLRATFSESVLGMAVFAVQTHWLKQMAAGVRPPITKTSDAEVIELVASKPGSIGYVSHDAQLPATVRAVALQ